MCNSYLNPVASSISFSIWIIGNLVISSVQHHNVPAIYPLCLMYNIYTSLIHLRRSLELFNKYFKNHLPPKFLCPRNICPCKTIPIKFYYFLYWSFGLQYRVMVSFGRSMTVWGFFWFFLLLYYVDKCFSPFDAFITLYLTNKL